GVALPEGARASRGGAWCGTGCAYDRGVISAASGGTGRPAGWGVCLWGILTTGLPARAARPVARECANGSPPQTPQVRPISTTSNCNCPGDHRADRLPGRQGNSPADG